MLNETATLSSMFLKIYENRGFSTFLKIDPSNTSKMSILDPKRGQNDPFLTPPQNLNPSTLSGAVRYFWVKNQKNRKNVEKVPKNKLPTTPDLFLTFRYKMAKFSKKYQKSFKI